LLTFCRYLRCLYPPEMRIAIVLDNFSPHLSTSKDHLGEEVAPVGLVASGPGQAGQVEAGTGQVHGQAGR
jgi:hypothetical protein